MVATGPRLDVFENSPEDEAPIATRSKGDIAWVNLSDRSGQVHIEQCGPRTRQVPPWVQLHNYALEPPHQLWQHDVALVDRAGGLPVSDPDGRVATGVRQPQLRAPSLGLSPTVVVLPKEVARGGAIHR